jgi:hypothetical protein
MREREKIGAERNLIPETFEMPAENTSCQL